MDCLIISRSRTSASSAHTHYLSPPTGRLAPLRTRAPVPRT